MKTLASLVALLVLSFSLLAADPPDLGARLQAVSVTIRSSQGEGSGVIVNRGGEAFVLTAGHVIDANRRVEKLLDAEKGAVRTVPKFDPLPDLAKVKLEPVEGSEEHGFRTYFNWDEPEFRNSRTILLPLLRKSGGRSLVVATFGR